MRDDVLHAHENKWLLPRVESRSRNEPLRLRSSLFLSGATWCSVATRAGRIGSYKRDLCAVVSRLNSRMRPPTIRLRFIEKSRGLLARGGSNAAHDGLRFQDLLFLFLMRLTVRQFHR